MLYREYRAHREDFAADSLEYNCRTIPAAFAALTLLLFFMVLINPFMLPPVPRLLWSLSLPLLMLPAALIGLKAAGRPNTGMLRSRFAVFYFLEVLVVWTVLFSRYAYPREYSPLLFFAGYLAASTLFFLRPLLLAALYLEGVALMLYLSGGECPHWRLAVAFGLAAFMLSVLRKLDGFRRFKAILNFRENQAKAELAMDGANLGYWNWNMDSDLIEVDSRWFGMLGRPPRSGIPVNEFFSLIHPDDRKEVARGLQEYFDSTQEKYQQTYRLETADGSYRWVYAEGKISGRRGDGSPRAMHGIQQDVHLGILQKQQLERSEARFRAYIEHSPVAVFVISGKTIVYANRQGAELTGYSIEELLSFPDFFVLVPPDTRAETRARMALFRLSRLEGPSLVVRIQTRTGGQLWAEVRGSVAAETDGEMVLSLVDITSRYEAEHRLEEYATYDELTQVFNRRVGLALLEKEIHRARREGTTVTIGFADIDGLKQVNDTIGHEAGDRLIIGAANAMKKVLRKGDIICRLGGDEFLLVHPECGAADARRLRKRIEEEFARENGRHSDFAVSASIGYSFFKPGSGPSQEISVANLVDQLVNEADQRMYIQKRKRRS